MKLKPDNHDVLKLNPASKAVQRFRPVTLEEFKLRSLYAELRLDHCVTSSFDDDNNEIYILDNYDYFCDLYRIELFVSNVINSNELGFEIIRGSSGEVVKVKPKSLGKELLSLKHAYLKDDKPYGFSVMVDLYFEVWRSFGVKWLVDVPLDHQMATGDIAAVFYNEYIKQLRLLGKSLNVRSKVYSRQRNVTRMSKAFDSYIDSLFSVYSKLCVVRIDLSYEKKYLNNVDIIDVKEDLNRLLNNKRNNGLFSDLAGYIWKLELGLDKGLHYHCFFFFNGSVKRNDKYYAAKIGTYWREVITKGHGLYFDCNKKKGSYKYNGIGLITHTDTQLIQNLKNAAKYLAKTSQFLQVKTSKYMKTMGKGQTPISSNKKRLGRPRLINK